MAVILVGRPGVSNGGRLRGAGLSEDANDGITCGFDGIKLICDVVGHRHFVGGNDAPAKGGLLVCPIPQDYSRCGPSASFKGVSSVRNMSPSVLGRGHVTRAAQRTAAKSYLPFTNKLRPKPHVAAQRGDAGGPPARPMLRGS